jgi:RNA polymerase sigma-70 factor (ECF subfamily)
VVLLRHKDDLSYEEIAEELGIPIGTVKARLHRAHRLLRSKLLETDSEDSS